MDESVSFWKRALALLCDLAIINLIIIYPFRGIFAKHFSNLSFADALNDGANLPNDLYLAVFFISILALLYFAFFDYYLGQTPGKKLLKLKVISLKDNSEDIGFWSAVLRNCFILPFFPFYVFWVVEPIYIAFYKEGFLDRITFTRVITEDNKSKKHEKYSDLKLSKVK
jgi:uncharacterized RDD family membrane protein YckC